MSDTLDELLERYDLPEKVSYCYQCGTCVGGCPVAWVKPAYSPRRLLQGLQAGAGAAILAEIDVWLCAYCHACLERCPQGIAVSEVLAELKHLAGRAGRAPSGEIAKLNTLLSTGYVIGPSESNTRRRVELGLPANLPAPDARELRTLCASEEV